MDREHRHNATDAVLHRELAYVWDDVDADPDVRVVVITGAGKAYSAGGDLEMLEDQLGDFPEVVKLAKEAGDLVRNMVECDKPIVSAINGVAVGAGLAVALMADVSVMAEDARLTDGHLRLGVGAGDHAVLVWPLLCGMARAKYLLMTAAFVDGRQAERIGLVSRCEPQDRVLPVALEIAETLALGPQAAVRWTKRTLNHWLRQPAPAFDASLAYEMLSFFSEDVAEGAAAIRDRRAPVFPPPRLPLEVNARSH